MRVRTLTREKLEKRLEVAENALEDARAAGMSKNVALWQEWKFSSV